MHLILVSFTLFSVCYVGLSAFSLQDLSEGMKGHRGRSALTSFLELSKLQGLEGLKGLSELSNLQGLAGLARLSELSKLQGSPPNIRDLLQSQQESPSNLGLSGLLDQKLNTLENRLSLLNKLNKLQGRNRRIICPPFHRPVTSTATSGTAENTETPLSEEYIEHTEHTKHPGHTTHVEPSFEPTEHTEHNKHPVHTTHAEPSLEPTESSELAGN
ncbi:UNVERIFIED_CONTAM: hypothetical protein RMT77_019102 [Armadillidium vulgare]